MRITPTTFNYWAQRTAPKSLLPAKLLPVTIDQVVNSNAGPRPAPNTDQLNTMSLIRLKRKHGEHIDWILEKASWQFPGEGQPDEIFGYQHIDKRVAFCRRLAKKLNLKGTP